MNNIRKCPFCKDGFLERKIIDDTYTYKNQNITVKQSGEFCNCCEEGILNGNDLKSTEKELNDFHAKVDGLLMSNEIKQIRKKLKLTQKQAATIFGGGANAFGRYERGEAKPVLAVYNLLKILDKHPKQLTEIY
jgi:HTH-type transcriptional regulator/antitoxin MqsA